MVNLTECGQSPRRAARGSTFRKATCGARLPVLRMVNPFKVADPRIFGNADLVATASLLSPPQLRSFGDIGGDASRLVAGEQRAAAHRPDALPEMI